MFSEIKISAAGFSRIDRSRAIAEELQQQNSDIKVRVVDLGSCLGRVDVYNSEGELVCKSFMPS